MSLWRQQRQPQLRTADAVALDKCKYEWIRFTIRLLYRLVGWANITSRNGILINYLKQCDYYKCYSCDCYLCSSIEFRVYVNVCELWSVNVIVRGRFWFNSNTDRFACILMFTDIRHSHHQEKSRSLLNIEIDFYKCAGWLKSK